MKVTFRTEESAGLTPREVKAKQTRDQQFRECYQALLKPQATSVVRVASGFSGLNLGEVLKGGAR